MLTEWQLFEIAQARHTAELETIRVGAILLCENSGNQTTCLCNRRDKCNDPYVQLPHTTYKGIKREDRKRKLATVTAPVIVLPEASRSSKIVAGHKFAVARGNLFHPTIDWDKAMPKIDPVYARRLRMGGSGFAVRHDVR
uniref:FLYWCH-type domain-containing protein n=1 Tax=Syphacia muris TaxID=451379 RepID=A0A0N5ARJ5_9BILA